MDKTELTFIAIFLGLVLSIVLTIASYNLYTSAKNRELYAECLRTVERISKESERRSMFVSTPNCYLR